MNRIIKFIKSPFDFFFSKLKITNNTTSKILSIAFAVIFWIYVIDQVNPEMKKWINDVPVQLQNESYLTNEGLLLMDSKEYLVDIEVSGRRNDILGFSSDDVVVSADLRGYGKGLNVIPIKKRVLNDNISISNISEIDIKIFIDKVVEIPKPVEVSIVGEIEKGYIRDDLVIEPQEIMVKGPETYVNSVSKIKGEIDITNITEDIGKEVPISPVDNDANVVNGVEIGESYVNVSLGIKKVKKVEIRSNVRGEVAEGYKLVSIDMIPNEATIKGYEEFLDEIDYIGTEEIDISGIYQTTEIETAIIIPYGVNLLYDIENLKVRANVEKIENK
jgi:YbbR domain-containing protein